MNADRTARFQDMEIHVVDRHERFTIGPGRLAPVGIEVPGPKLASQLGQPRCAEHLLAPQLVAEVVGEQIAVLEHPDAAVRGRALADAEIVLPAAHHHRELVAVVRSAERVPAVLRVAAPRELEPERPYRMHCVVGDIVEHFQRAKLVLGIIACAVERRPVEIAEAAFHEIGPRDQFAAIHRGLALDSEQSTQSGAGEGPELEFVAVRRLVIRDCEKRRAGRCVTYPQKELYRAAAVVAVLRERRGKTGRVTKGAGTVRSSPRPVRIRVRSASR